MSDRTAIEWTDASWNPIRARDRQRGKIGWHCERKSEGCRFCYAEPINRRLGTGWPYLPGRRQDGTIEVFLDEKTLLQPLRWKKPRTIFVCSMTDLFADFVSDEMIDRVFGVMALASQHRFQVLTKRSARMRAYCQQLEDEPAVATVKRMAVALGPMPVKDMTFPSPNVWLGVSAEDQARADKRIPDLLATPAAVRFVSLEPLLGAIDLWHEEEGLLRGPAVIKSGGVTRSTPDTAAEGYDDSYVGLDWVIVGGESGPNARPMHPDWARKIRDDCAAAGVPFFFKQWGEWAPSAAVEGPGKYRLLDGGVNLKRVGKRNAGRQLDGVEHNGMPA